MEKNRASIFSISWHGMKVQAYTGNISWQMNLCGDAIDLIIEFVLK